MAYHSSVYEFQIANLYSFKVSLQVRKHLNRIDEEFQAKVNFTFIFLSKLILTFDCNFLNMKIDTTRKLRNY